MQSLKDIGGVPNGVGGWCGGRMRPGAVAGWPEKAHHRHHQIRSLQVLQENNDSRTPNLQNHVKWQRFLGFPSPRAVKPLRGQTWQLTEKQNVQKVLSYNQQDIPVLEARSIEEIYDALTERLLPSAALAHDLKTKYIVGLAGPPGSGKTTLASEVVHRLNTLWSKEALKMGSSIPGDIATVLPMDGFHLYRSQLDLMENPEEAHARRGAPWTFDPDRLFKCLNELRNKGSVFAPSFDHGVGDPVEDDVFVSLQHKVVIVEGNYLYLKDGVWKDISAIFDEKWFIDIDIDNSMRRVLKRHISTGKEPDVAKWRIDYNDRPNAELILMSKNNADLVIKSVDL